MKILINVPRNLDNPKKDEEYPKQDRQRLENQLTHLGTLQLNPIVC